jgi:hypothetical protein
MYYLTGSRCWPPTIPGVSLKKTISYPYCGTPGASYPEGESAPWVPVLRRARLGEGGRGACARGRGRLSGSAAGAEVPPASGAASSGGLLADRGPCALLLASLLAEFWNCADVRIQ